MSIITVAAYIIGIVTIMVLNKNHMFGDTDKEKYRKFRLFGIVYEIGFMLLWIKSFKSLVRLPYLMDIRDETILSHLVMGISFLIIEFIALIHAFKSDDYFGEVPLNLSMLYAPIYFASLLISLALITPIRNFFS